jgi:hypothetical protein
MRSSFVQGKLKGLLITLGVFAVLSKGVYKHLGENFIELSRTANTIQVVNCLTREAETWHDTLDAAQRESWKRIMDCYDLSVDGKPRNTTLSNKSSSANVSNNVSVKSSLEFSDLELLN